jgi:baseplate J-like protein
MANNIEQEIRAVLAQMDNGEQQEQQTPPEDIQDIYVLIVREHGEVEEDQPQVIDSEPVTPPDKPTQSFPYLTLSIVLVCLLPMLASILLQVYLLQNPPIATVTITPKSQTVTLSGTVQLGRLLQPLTISQSQITPTTGKGHQDAQAATGTVTFYNGQQTEQTIVAGTVFTGQNGVSIETTQSATIPPGNPSTGYGTVTVTAQALQAGSNGNIQAGDVNSPIAIAVFVKNNQFRGGQDERDFSTVSQQDIHRVSTTLEKSVALSMQAVLQGQLSLLEQLQLLPCTPTVISDHPIGAEATSVKVTVSQTCSAVAYRSQDLATKATAYLANKAQQTTGAGYSLFGTVLVSLKQTSVTNTPHPLVFLSFQATGTWIYALFPSAQQQIKHLIAGKSTQQAAQSLAALPGIERATIHFSGISDPERVPKSTQNIHLVLLVL